MFPQVYQEYCENVKQSIIKGILEVKKEIDKIKKIDKESVKKYYKARKDRAFQWYEYKAYYKICGIVNNK